MTTTSYARACTLALGSALLSLQPGGALADGRQSLPGVEISRQWQESSAITTQGADGTVTYLYGHSQPRVKCSPLHLCEISLEAGEAVRDVLVGDSVRWQIEAATSGSAVGQRVHLVVKPAEAGLETSMVVTTSRRTYHIALQSGARDYMARVAFSYPDAIRQSIEIANRGREASIIPGAGVPAEHLNFDFSISGSARWKPTRIYTDGAKTYIQFPSHLASGHAPVLFVQSGGENQIVNYRIKDAMMIVDYLIDTAVLLEGVGNHQQRISIERRR